LETFLKEGIFCVGMPEHVHKEILEDICGNCKGKYCILKEIILHSGLNDRSLEQLKCVERFKYERSGKERKDIGWSEAHLLWVTEGHAKMFDKIYKDGMRNGEIYSLMMDRKK